MRSTILLLILMAAIAGPAMAQQKGLSVGIEAGPGIRTLLGSSTIAGYTRFTAGYGAGLGIQYNFSKIFAIRTGFSYDLKGAISKDLVLTDNVGMELGMSDVSHNYYYATFPVMFRASVGSNKVRFMYNVGLFASYLLDYEVKVKQKELQDYIGDYPKNYDEFDAGTTIGLGVNIKLKEMFNISVEVRNYMGVLNINNTGSYESGSTRTMSTMLLIGLSHNLSKPKE